MTKLTHRGLIYTR